MNIVLSRVDERLAHGQVITSWAKQKEIKKILVIDDGIAKDSFMCDVMRMAGPSGVSIEVVSIETALNMLSENTSNENTMLLFKYVEAAYKLVNAGYAMDRLNIGNIGSGPSRKAVTKRVYMSSTEIQMAKELSEKGVYVYLQMLHTDAEVDINVQI